MSLRSPLGQVLGSGSARDGTGHWWAQRVSAVALTVLGIGFLWSLTQLEGTAQAQVVTWISIPWNSVLLLVLCGARAWHSSLGVQVIIEDYVHGPLLKVASLLLNRYAHLAAAIAAAYAVLRISLGAAA